MDVRRTQTVDRQSSFHSYAAGIDHNSQLVQERLNTLLTINAEIEREKSTFKNDRERLAAEMMKSPISTEKALSYFGTMLGLFPPFAIFSRFLFDHFKGVGNSDDFWLIPLLLFVNLICTVAGYFSGKIVGKIIVELEKLTWSKMLLTVPFIGIMWGVVTGAAGGVFIFVIGAFFGAMIAAAVGSVALPAFTVLHRALKHGDMIEEKHFFPLALGISCIVTALILGLNIS